MLSLWSRAGQAHHCGCRACSSAINGLGRRATTAAGRRKPTFGELFTACYSSVFATAAVVDAIQKEDRRQDLDNQLEEARRELAELREREVTRRGLADLGERCLPQSLESESESGVLNLNEAQSYGLTRSLQQLILNRPYMKEIHEPAQHSISELVQKLKAEHYQCPNEPPSAIRRLVDYDKLERAIIEEESDESIPCRQSLNKTQLRYERDMSERLIRELLARVSKRDKGKLPSPSFDEAQQLLSKHYPNYTFRAINQIQAHQNTVALNRTIRSIMSASEVGWKEKVGQVCYNLLVSAHAPNMLTYNTLIVAFDKAAEQSGFHNLSESVVSSFFFGRRLRPTPATYQAVLNHYKATSNHGRFLRTVSCIVGLDERTGAKISRRHVQDAIEQRSIRAWAMDPTRRTLSGQYVYENVPLTKDLVETIMSGLVYFKLFEQAASLFLTCVRSGVILSAKVVRDMVDGCIGTLDWNGAVHLACAFVACDIKQPRLIQSGEDSDFSYLIERIPVVLDICGLYRNGKNLTADQLGKLGISKARLCRLLETLEQGTATLSESVTESLELRNARMHNRLGGTESRLLQVESLLREYVRVRKTTNSIESKLLGHELPHEIRISLGEHIVREASVRSMKLSAEFRVLLQSRSISHRDSPVVGKGFQSFEENIKLWLSSGEEVSQTARDGPIPPELEAQDCQQLYKDELEGALMSSLEAEEDRDAPVPSQQPIRVHQSRWSAYKLVAKPWVAGHDRQIRYNQHRLALGAGALG